jgi:hypothetical protein
MNLSTVTGCAVLQAVIDQTHLADDNRQKKAEEAAIQKVAAEEKLVQILASREQAWTVSLKLAGQLCKIDCIAKMKKAELVAALEAMKLSGQQLPDDANDEHGDSEEDDEVPDDV